MAFTQGLAGYGLNIRNASSPPGCIYPLVNPEKYVNFRMSSEHEFLDIPGDEHIVPFPNAAAVIMQHAREFPERAALVFKDARYTYRDILEQCQKTIIPDRDIRISLKDPEHDLLLIILLLYHGKVFHLDLKAATNIRPENLPQREVTENERELPFVRLDDPALILKGHYRFTQYNLLVAAQAAGNTFKLFRPGDAVCSLPLNSMTDLCFGILAPLYFAKSLRFDRPDPAGEVLKGTAQYAYAGLTAPSIPLDNKELLRDAAILFKARREAFSSPVSFYIEEEIPYAAGLTPVTNNEGDPLSFLGAEMEKKNDSWIIRGHCVGI